MGALLEAGRDEEAKGAQTVRDGDHDDTGLVGQVEAFVEDLIH